MQSGQAKQFLETIWNQGTRKLLFREDGRNTVNKNSYIIQGKEKEKTQCKSKWRRWDTYNSYIWSWMSNTKSWDPREMAQRTHMETMLEEMIKQIKNVYNKAYGPSWKVENFWRHRIGKWVTASAFFQEMVSK